MHDRRQIIAHGIVLPQTVGWMLSNTTALMSYAAARFHSTFSMELRKKTIANHQGVAGLDPITADASQLFVTMKEYIWTRENKEHAQRTND